MLSARFITHEFWQTVHIQLDDTTALYITLYKDGLVKFSSNRFGSEIILDKEAQRFLAGLLCGHLNYQMPAPKETK